MIWWSYDDTCNIPEVSCFGRCRVMKIYHDMIGWYEKMTWPDIWYDNMTWWRYEDMSDIPKVSLWGLWGVMKIWYYIIRWNDKISWYDIWYAKWYDLRICMIFRREVAGASAGWWRYNIDFFFFYRYRYNIDMIGWHNKKI